MDKNEKDIIECALGYHGVFEYNKLAGYIEEKLDVIRKTTTMKLYEVTSGHTLESYVRVYVIAENKYDARCIAKHKFLNELDDLRHYSNLDVKCICEDTSQLWSTIITGCLKK